MRRRSWSTRIATLLHLGLLACLCCLAPSQGWAALSWEVSEVDDSGNVGKFVSIAADGDNKLHLGYLEQRQTTLPTYALRYATNKSGVWVAGPVQNQNLLAGAVVFAGTVVATDPTTHLPHIGYYYNASTSNRGFRTIALGAASWGNPTPINGSFTPSAEGSAAIFSKDGFSHIAFVKNSGNGTAALNYVKNTTAGNYGTWDPPVPIDSTDLSGANSSIVVDSRGFVHIVGYNSSSTDLFYYTNVSGGWVKSTVATSPAVAGKWCTLAIDSADNLHLAYLETTAAPAAYNIKYRTKGAAETSWESDVPVAAVGAFGGYPSLRVDNAGVAHLSYYYAENSTAGILQYATNASGTWTSSVVDQSSANVGKFSSLTLDRDQNVVIAYYDVTRSSLKVAYRKRPALTADRSSVSFGIIDRGMAAAAETVTVTNNLQENQTLGVPMPGGLNAEEFVITNDGCSNAVLLPNGTCTISVTFAPPLSAPRSSGRSATVTLATSAPNGNLTIPVSGTVSDNYILSASAGNGGSISPELVAVAPGGSQTFTITPAPGFWVSGVIADGITAIPAPYTLSPVTADHVIRADLASAVRVMESGTYYGSLQSAYGASNDQWTIETLVGAREEDLLLDRNLEVNLYGGYDSTFTTRSGTTSARSITVTDGTVTLEGLLFQ